MGWWMRARWLVLAVALAGGLRQAPAATMPLDLSEIREGPVQAEARADSLAVTWPDAYGRSWQAIFSLDPEKPLITSIALGDRLVVQQARPFYQVETGTRRRGWNAFFDFPPSHPDGTRHFQAEFTPRSAKARSIGERLEVSFDGLRLGIFEGSIAYTFYPGSTLIQQEAVAKTTQDNVAYYYDAGLGMRAPWDEQPGGNMRTQIRYYDTEGKLRGETSHGLEPERTVVRARYRTLAVATNGGSVAVFPEPHRFFFPRDFTSNLGFLWHRSWRGQVALGIRQIRDENWVYYPWVNAPPGTTQRMGVFFLLSIEAPEAVLEDVLRYTRGDRFAELPGYKTLSTHWHLAYTVQALAQGFPWTPPFKPVLKDMGVDASIIMDFHGDGHPRDLTDLRLDELDAYFRACRTQSDPDFLLIPSEEANVHFGGHWAVIFPKPVYWFMGRPEGGSFEMHHPKHGKVYSVADAHEMLQLIRRENGYMYQTHPRTKGSTGFPDQIRNTEYFTDPRYLGAGWKALPADLSTPRLGERALHLLDDMNNWGLHKRIFGEVDVFQFDQTHELYAYMNINYVKLDHLPDFDHYGAALEPLGPRRFFHDHGRSAATRVEHRPRARRPDPGQRRVTLDVPAAFRRDRLGRWHQDRPQDHSAGLHAGIRRLEIRMDGGGARLEMGPAGGVGYRRQRGVRQPSVAKLTCHKPNRRPCRNSGRVRHTNCCQENETTRVQPGLTRPNRPSRLSP